MNSQDTTKRLMAFTSFLGPDLSKDHCYSTESVPKNWQKSIARDQKNVRSPRQICRKPLVDANPIHQSLESEEIATNLAHLQEMKGTLVQRIALEYSHLVGYLHEELEIIDVNSDEYNETLAAREEAVNDFEYFLTLVECLNSDRLGIYKHSEGITKPALSTNEICNTPNFMPLETSNQKSSKSRKVFNNYEHLQQQQQQPNHSESRARSVPRDPSTCNVPVTLQISNSNSASTVAPLANPRKCFSLRNLSGSLSSLNTELPPSSARKPMQFNHKRHLELPRQPPTYPVEVHPSKCYALTPSNKMKASSIQTTRVQSKQLHFLGSAIAENEKTLRQHRSNEASESQEMVKLPLIHGSFDSQPLMSKDGQQSEPPILFSDNEQTYRNTPHHPQFCDSEFPQERTTCSNTSYLSTSIDFPLSSDMKTMHQRSFSPSLSSSSTLSSPHGALMEIQDLWSKQHVSSIHGSLNSDTTFTFMRSYGRPNYSQRNCSLSKFDENAYLCNSKQMLQMKVSSEQPSLLPFNELERLTNRMAVQTRTSDAVPKKRLTLADKFEISSLS